MVNFKKMDEQDFIFINKSLNEKDEKAFSAFLKNRKLKGIIKKRKKPTSGKIAIS